MAVGGVALLLELDPPVSFALVTVDNFLKVDFEMENGFGDFFTFGVVFNSSG